LEKNMRLREPNLEREARLPPFSGEVSGASVDPLVPRSFRVGHREFKDPTTQPGGSLEVGRLPPEVERNPPIGSRPIAVARTTIHTGDGNKINGSSTV
jgi:hypothetical protein